MTIWEGNYYGTSHQKIAWSEGSDSIDYHESNTYKKVFVNVVKGSMESTLDFSIAYDDTLFVNYDSLKFSVNGYFLSEEGAGSRYRSIDIQLHGDSLKFHKYQACGMACVSRLNFIAIKEDR